MSTTSKSFTATGFGPVFRARKGESFNYSVAGTFVGTVVLEKLDGASLNVIDTITTKTAAATGNVTSYEGGLYRWRCSAFTSGTIETALSDSIDEGDDNPVVIEKNVNEWRLGPGIFEITSEIVLGTDVKRIIGVPGQTTIKAAATITNIINATGDDCYLEGLIIDGGSLAKKGIRISGVDGLTVKDVVIQNTTENCVYGTSGDNVKLIRVKCPDGLGAIGKTFDDMDAEAWVWQNFYFDNGIFNNLLLEDCEGALLVKSNNAVVDNVKVWGGKYSNQEKMGIEVLNDTTNVTNFYIGGGLEAKGNGYNAQISLNAIDGGDCSDFYIDGVDNSTYGLEVISCSNMNFHDYRVKECSRNVLVSGTTTDLTFDNQILEAATGHYFFVQDADRVDILNTTITTSDGTNAYGITITNCDYTRVDGVNGFGNSAVKKLIYLNHSANHNDVSIDNIHAVNFSEHLIYFDASTAVTLTRYRVGDNITALSIGSGIGIDTDVTFNRSNIPTDYQKGVGAAAGSGVTVIELGNDAVHKSIFKFTNVAIPLTDNAGVIAYGGLKFYDFPEGWIMVTTAVTDLDITKSSAGVNADWDGDFSVGTVTASNNNTLTSTEANIIPSTATPQAVSGVTTANGASNSTTRHALINGTSTAVDLYINFLVDDVDHDVTTTPCNLILNGTVTVVWVNMGDY